MRAPLTFQRTFTCGGRATLRIEGLMHTPIILWDGGRPTREVLAEYREWMRGCLQHAADHFDGTILYVLGGGSAEVFVPSGNAEQGKAA